MADLLDENASELASIQSLENGKPFANSFEEVRRSAKVFRYYAGCVDKIHGSTIPAGKIIEKFYYSQFLIINIFCCKIKFVFIQSHYSFFFNYLLFIRIIFLKV